MSQHKTVVFIDRFDNNMNNWIVDSTATVTSKIAMGKYLTYHTTTEGNWWMTKQILFDDKKEYDIEVQILSFHNDGQYFSGLIWGAEDQHIFEFSLSPAGYFRILERTEYGTKPWKSETFSDAIVQGTGQRNTLRIAHKHQTWQFLVNDSLVYTAAATKKLAHGIGFFTEGIQGAAFDNLRVLVERDIEPDETGHYRLVFRDDFKDNLNHWRIDAQANIEMGGYTINTHIDSIFYYEQDISIDPGRAFEIEAVFRNIEYHKTTGYGLCWADSVNAWEFLISGNGYFAIYRTKSGKTKDLKKWTGTGTLRRGAYSHNKVSILYKPPTFYFYINEQIVLTETFKSGDIEGVGVVAYGGQKISVDYLTVRSDMPDDLSSKIRDMPKVLVQGKEFRESDPRFVEIISPLMDDDEGWGYEDLYGEVIDYEDEPDIDYASWFILADNVTDASQVPYRYDNDNLILENLSSESINLSTAVKHKGANYLIEMQYAITTTVDHTVHGIFFGNEGLEECYSFVMDGGFVFLAHDKEDGETILKNWAASGASNQNNGAMNKYAILVKDGKLSLFINNRLVYEGNNRNPPPDEIAFQVSENQKIEMDYIKVYSIE